MLRDASLYEAERLLIYGGAGVTIDRSGLGWKAMVDGLLSQYVQDRQTRDDIFSANSVLETASLAIEYFRKDYGDEHFRDRIADRLRLMLYVPGDWQAGILADSVASLCASVASSKRGFVLATPNYDDYLVEALMARIGSIDVTTSTSGNNDAVVAPRLAKSAGWMRSRQNTQDLFDSATSIVQLHGLIPRNRTINEGRVLTPVIGELDYINSEPYTYRALRSLLREAPALFIGTSLTDRPLLQALAQTRNSSPYPRFALVPIGLDLESDRERQRRLRASQLERYEHFGVTPVYVDYHFQIAQFVQELTGAVSHASVPVSRAKSTVVDGETDGSFVTPTSDHQEDSAPEVGTPRASSERSSYGQRLLKWSADWISLQNLEGLDTSTISAALTEYAEEQVRLILDVSASEVTKLELWVRDSPRTHRGLRLWQSTVSLHLQEESARRANFSNASEIVAVHAFVEGRPVISSVKRDESPHQRWRTYLSTPIWVGEDARGDYGRLPVGAIVMASMRQAERSGLVRLKRRREMREAMDLLVWLGDLLTDTDPENWRILQSG